MKIAMFTDAYYPRINGVAVSVRTYARALVQAGHKVCIVCCDYDGLEDSNLGKGNHFHYDDKDEISENLEIFRIPSTHVFISKEDKAAKLSAWHAVKHEMDRFKPDVIHINSEFLVGYFGLIYARHRKVASVFTFHTLWEEYVEGYIKFMPVYPAKKIAKQLIKFYLKRADVVITPTERIAQVVSDYNVSRPVRILPTGIPKITLPAKNKQNKPFFYRLNKIVPFVQKKHILLYVGRMVKEKNLDFLFSVLMEVKKSVPDTALVFVGGGAEFEPLKARAKKLKCSWDICFAGYRNKDELAYFYDISDVFVFPSKTETQGLVTIEAMMAGLPVVAIGEMGTVDVMQGDNGGFMVKDNVDEFSKRVISLLKDKELYKQKSLEAEEWSKKWELESLTPKLVSYYQEAIEINKINKESL